MSGGYVYVIAFDNGVVKVGRSEKVKNRLKSHEAMARVFGLAVTAKWESPEHDGWVENERELMRLARELGGVPITDEYFTGVCFDAIAAEAAELSFPLPRPEAAMSRQDPYEGIKNLRRMPQWLASDFAETTGRVYYRDYCVEDALEHLADRVLTSPGIMRLLAKQYASRRLKKSLSLAQARDGLHVKPEPPEPPEPRPPLASGSRDREHLQLIVTDALAQLAAQDAA